MILLRLPVSLSNQVQSHYSIYQVEMVFEKDFTAERGMKTATNQDYNRQNDRSPESYRIAQKSSEQEKHPYVFPEKEWLMR